MANSPYLYLVWKHPQTRRNYIVGKLTHDNGFSFEYCEEFEEAKAQNLPLLDTFPEKKQYKSEILFPVFSSRLPDPKRRDISTILKKYEMDEYDEFELLRKSGARLPFDTYGFIDPIFPEDQPIERDFFIMGIRHTSLCGGEDCSLLPPIEVGDSLILRPEPTNPNDSNAIIVETAQGAHLGYIPRYYNQGILYRLNLGQTYSCIVTEINSPQIDCSECIKVRLNIPKAK